MAVLMSSSGAIGANTMQDVIFLAVTIVFFAMSVGYVIFCERVR